VLVPAGGVVLCDMAGRLVHRRLRPSLAARFLAALSAVSAMAVAALLVLLTVLFSTQFGSVDDVLGWCAREGRRLGVPAWLTGLGVVGLGAVLGRFVRAYRRQRRALIAPFMGPLVILPTSVPVAYSDARPPGSVVVSAGMLRTLDADERQVLFAHERSHLRHRHDRYLRLAELSSSVPLVRPLAKKLRFALERWADEDAAAEVRDRTLVAKAIAQAALAQVEAPDVGALGMADVGVPARVDALLADGGRTSTVARVAATTTATAALLTVAVGVGSQLDWLLRCALHAYG
jgi:hypothetical protein